MLALHYCFKLLYFVIKFDINILFQISLHRNQIYFGRVFGLLSCIILMCNVTKIVILSSIENSSIFIIKKDVRIIKSTMIVRFLFELGITLKSNTKSVE